MPQNLLGRLFETRSQFADDVRPPTSLRMMADVQAAGRTPPLLAAFTRFGQASEVSEREQEMRLTKRALPDERLTAGREELNRRELRKARGPKRVGPEIGMYSERLRTSIRLLAKRRLETVLETDVVVQVGRDVAWARYVADP